MIHWVQPAANCFTIVTTMGPTITSRRIRMLTSMTDTVLFRGNDVVEDRRAPISYFRFFWDSHGRGTATKRKQAGLACRSVGTADGARPR
jgi:hypothetical protein